MKRIKTIEIKGYRIDFFADGVIIINLVYADEWVKLSKEEIKLIYNETFNLMGDNKEGGKIMVLVFGKTDCKQCKQKLKEMREKKIEFQYYDLDTAEGLAKAASLDLLSENRDLPIIIDITLEVI